MILVTGASGQLGKLFIHRLLSLGYKNKIIAVSRSGTDFDSAINLKADLQNLQAVKGIFSKYPITKILNFATSSFVNRNLNWDDCIKLNNCKIFDNIISVEESRNAWIMHPSSSEIFGAPESKQGLNSLMSPVNSYGLQKSVELLKCRLLNDQGYKIFHPILFNHESNLRSEKFFTKRVLNKFLYQTKEPLHFYNANSQRDFSYAPHLVENLLIAMKENITGDEVFGSGTAMSVLDFIVAVMEELNITYRIEEKSRLVKIFDENNNLLASELDRSAFDERRKFCFDGIRKNQVFLESNVYGKNLIKQLIYDAQKG